MSIELNTNTKAVNWETLLSSIGDVKKAESVDGKESFVITTKVGGETVTTAITIPDDLEIPEKVDAAALQSLVDKLGKSGLGLSDEQIAKMKDEITSLYREAASAVGEVNSKSRGNVMFDLYALMALLIDVAQSQRNAQREIRTCQNLNIQKSIQDQADQQRNAASVGMWVGIVCGAFSAIGSLAVMGAQSVTAKQQANIMNQSGADAAKMHASMLQNTDTTANAHTQLVNTMEKVGGDNVAGRVTREFEAQIVDDQAGNLRTNLSAAISENNAAKTDVMRKETNLASAQEQLTQKQGVQDVARQVYEKKNTTFTQKQEAYEAEKTRVVENETEEAKTGRINAAKEQFEAAKTARDTAKAELDSVDAAVQRLQQQVPTLQNDLSIANGKLATSETKLAQARSDYQKTVGDVAAQYKEKYQTAVDRLAHPEAGADKAQLQANVDAARKDMEMAFAVEADLLAAKDVMTPSQQKDVVAAARAQVDVTMDRVYQRSEFKSFDRRMTTLAGIGNINQAVGGVLQSMSQSISVIKASDATRQEAQTKKEEEMIDQTRDLFKQEQSLIDQVVQLYSAVIQAESQSMRDAIQA